MPNYDPPSSSYTYKKHDEGLQAFRTISIYEKRCLVCDKSIFVDESSKDANWVCSQECMNVINVNPLPYDKCLDNINVYEDISYTSSNFTFEVLNHSETLSRNRVLMRTTAMSSGI